MKIMRTEILIDVAKATGPKTSIESSNIVEISDQEKLPKEAKFSDTEIWKTLYQQVIEGIHQCRWPLDAPPGSFKLFDEKQANGVKPIKVDCMKYLFDHGWELEKRFSVATALRPGPLDAAYQVGNKYFCFEWETGNISSSHRALGKLTMGLIQGEFIGGILVVPSRVMYNLLTDRIGNIRELEPYFPIYRAVSIEEGILAIIIIEHDEATKDVEAIPKGNDGNSLARRRLLEVGLPISKLT